MSGLRNKNFLSSGFALSLKCILPPPFQKQILKNVELTELGGFLDLQTHFALLLKFTTSLALGLIVNLQVTQILQSNTSVLFKFLGKLVSLPPIYCVSFCFSKLIF